MTPPPAEPVAAMIRPAPVRVDSKVNRDLLRVMEGASVGYWVLLHLAVAFMLTSLGLVIVGGRLGRAAPAPVPTPAQPTPTQPAQSQPGPLGD